MHFALTCLSASGRGEATSVLTVQQHDRNPFFVMVASSTLTGDQSRLSPAFYPDGQERAGVFLIKGPASGAGQIHAQQE